MKKIIFALCFAFLFTATDDAFAKKRMIKGKLYFSTHHCLILKTVTGRKFNLKNYGALEPDQRVKLEVEDIAKGEEICDGPGRGVTVVRVVKTYPKLTGKGDSSKVAK
jgi:hypothetical protein